jgi:hypothetical protein
MKRRTNPQLVIETELKEVSLEEENEKLVERIV